MPLSDGREAIVFACYGGDRFWPLTADVAVFAASLDRTVRALGPKPPRRWLRPAPASRYGSLDSALAGLDGHVLFLVGTDDGRTAVLSTYGLDHAWLRARAELDLRCDLIWTTFRPAGADVEPEARFGDFRVAPPDQPIPTDLRQTNELTIDLLRADHAWSFHRLGPARPYEEDRFYREPTKADRLPFDLLARYAAGAGLPIGDLGFLAGPVATVPDPHPATDPVWSTIAELRAVSGYPATGVVTSLTGRRRPTPAPTSPPPVDLPVTRLTPDGALPVWTVDLPTAERWPTLARLSGTVEGWVPVLLAKEPEDCAAFDPDAPPGTALRDAAGIDELDALAKAGLGRVEPATAAGTGTLDWPATADVTGTLCLVPAADPADVLAVLDWSGPANVMTTAELTVLLRRWHRLSGATLVAADPGGSSVELLITRPAADPAPMLTELELCCDELTRRDRLVRLWWD
jgi:hypothetical protein